MHVTNFDDDLIGLRDFSHRLLRFIDVEHHFVDGSLVIGLSSKYGSGKTTFFRMLKDDLEKGNPIIGPVTVVSLNAWESDYFGDPLFSIVSALVGRIQESGQEANPIVSAAKDLGWFATAVGGQVVAKFTGINPVAAGEIAEKKKAARDAPPLVPLDAFTIYQGRENAMAQLKAALDNFINELHWSQSIPLTDLHLESCPTIANASTPSVNARCSQVNPSGVGRLKRFSQEETERTEDGTQRPMRDSLTGEESGFRKLKCSVSTPPLPPFPPVQYEPSPSKQVQELTALGGLPDPGHHQKVAGNRLRGRLS